MLRRSRRRLLLLGNNGNVRAPLSANATMLSFTTQPGLSGASPYTLSPQPVVKAVKSDGTTVDTLKTGTVTISLIVFSGAATLGGTTTKALSSGVADFSANSLAVTATSTATWALVATLSGLANATSSTGTTTVAANVAPNTPTISAGAPTSSGVTLTGSAFSDPDVGDTQAASQWQVTTAADPGYASPGINTGDDATHKTSLAVTGLSASTAYIARVRYKDSAGNYSAWSANASFTTAAAATGFSATPLAHTKKAGNATFTTTGIDTTGATLLVAAVHRQQATAVTFSDSKGNTWSSGTEFYDNNSVRMVFYYCINPIVGTGHTFTVTGTAGMFAAVEVSAWGGPTAPVFGGQSAGATVLSASSVASGSLTPATNGALILSTIGYESAHGATNAIDSGFTILDVNDFGTGAGSNYGGATASLVQGAAASVNASWSWTSGADSAGAIAIYFKPA